jgi:hypothetical protein
MFVSLVLCLLSAACFAANDSDKPRIEVGYVNVLNNMFSVSAGATITSTVNFTVAHAALINGSDFDTFVSHIKSDMTSKCFGAAQQYAVAEQTGVVASALTGCVFADNVTAYLASNPRTVNSWNLDTSMHTAYWKALGQAKMRAGVFTGTVKCSGTQPYSVDVTIRMGVTSVVYQGVRHVFPNVEQYLCMQTDGSTDGVKTDAVNISLGFIDTASPRHGTQGSNGESVLQL